MQLIWLFRALHHQLMKEPVRKKPMESVFDTPLVERHHEEIELLGAPQLIPRIVSPGDGPTQVRIEPVEHRALHEKNPQILRHLGDYFPSEIVGNTAMVAGELIDEFRRVLPASQ
jgi:hypothetical protein